MNTTKSIFVRNVALAACLAISALGTVAHAQDDATALTPPVQAPPAAPAPVAGADATVFNWKDVPVNQHIKITRAVFDQGGYQLYAGTGETIVVPFVNNNLYAMKFGQTIGGDMFFVNDGTAPTLYMPKTAYLENAATQGAKWYPFSDNFDYNGPVYEGIAPTWDAYQDMGWYPGMACYGGYWGYQPYGFGVGFECMPGFCFSIFGEPYFGWGGYYGYYSGHPYNRFGWGGGYGHYGAGFHGNGTFGRGGFGGGGHVGGGVNHGGAFGGAFGNRTAMARNGAFGGASGNRRAFSAQPNRGSMAFGGARAFSGSNGRAFGGGSTFSRSPFSSGNRSFGGSSFGGGGRTFSGGSSFGGARSFGGGGSAHFSGGSGGSHFSGGGGGSHFGGGGGGGSHGGGGHR